MQLNDENIIYKRIINKNRCKFKQKIFLKLFIEIGFIYYSFFFLQSANLYYFRDPGYEYPPEPEIRYREKNKDDPDFDNDDDDVDDEDLDNNLVSKNVSMSMNSNTIIGT